MCWGVKRNRVESPQQHSNAFTDLGEGIDEEDDPLSQAARMSESLLQLDTLRHRLAVLPSTQWVIAHADFDGRRLEAVSQRHRQVTEALTTAGKSPLGRHSRASTAAGSRQQARDREAQAMAQRHQARTWRRVLGGGGREMDGDEGGRQGAASQGTDLRAHAKRKGAPWFVALRFVSRVQCSESLPVTEGGGCACALQCGGDAGALRPVLE